MATITQPNIAREKWIYALTSVISYPEFAALAVYWPNPVEGNGEWTQQFRPRISLLEHRVSQRRTEMDLGTIREQPSNVF